MNERQYEMLKKLVYGFLVFCLFAFSASGLSAQTFTERAQKSKQGEGQLTIHHDAAIDALVNKPAAKQSSPAAGNSGTPKVGNNGTPNAGNNSTPKAGQSPQPSSPSAQDTPEPDSLDNSHRVVRSVVKATGYRVQVYAGGNTRVDHQKALRAKEELKSAFPGEPIYVHMYPPRWVCRIGNYRTYEEAHQMLVEVKKLGFKSATIIKGKVTLPQY